MFANSGLYRSTDAGTHELYLCSGRNTALVHDAAAASEQAEGCNLCTNRSSVEWVKYQTQIDIYFKAIIFLKHAIFFGQTGLSKGFIQMKSVTVYAMYVIIIIESIVPSRNIGCLWVLSTSVYQLLGNLVPFQLLPASLITDFLQLYFGLSLFLFPWGFQSRAAFGTSPSSFLNVWPTQLNFFFLFLSLYLPVLLLSIGLYWK